MGQDTIHLDPLIADLITSRKAQKVTQAQLAELAGLSRRALVAIENGGNCTLSTLRRLYTVLGMDLVSRPFAKPTLEDVYEENKSFYTQPAKPSR